jgi:serine/threonine protein phosphatase PrpC
LIEWGVAARPIPGETRSGDLHVVAPFTGGVLVAVVDGLGHGDEASDAAAIAGDILARSPSEPLIHLIQRCDEALRSTRGAAMTVASFVRSDATLSWIGVGNVEAALFRAVPSSDRDRVSVVLRGGVVGYRLPRLMVSYLPVSPNDTLVMATDGVDSRCFQSVPLAEAPDGIANDLLARFASGTDDALVLVARYRGDDA